MAPMSSTGKIHGTWHSSRAFLVDDIHLLISWWTSKIEKDFVPSPTSNLDTNAFVVIAILP